MNNNLIRILCLFAFAFVCVHCKPKSKAEVEIFGLKWHDLISDKDNLPTNDYLANLEALQQHDCEEGKIFTTKYEIELCDLFQNLPVPIDKCNVREINYLRTAIEEALQDWSWFYEVDNHDEHLKRGENFALKQYLGYAEMLAKKCAREHYDLVLNDSLLPWDKPELELASDLIGSCKSAKKSNPFVQRKDVNSLLCYIELLKPTASNSNIITDKTTLAKLLAFMNKKLGKFIGIQYKSDGIREQFVGSILKTCEHNGISKSVYRAATFYKSILLRDEYFPNEETNDKYFEMLKFGLVCQAILEHKDEIIEGIGGARANLLAKIL